MAVKFVSKEDIVRQVKILDICDEFGIDVEPISSGNFNWRCTCPAKNHKGGNERTPSLYIDSVNNNYYCYGCQSSHNCLDFYMICADVNFSEALSELRTRVTKGSGKKYTNLNADNLPILLEISKLFRETIYSHPEDLKWLNGLMKQTDEYLEGIEKKEVQKTKALLRSLRTKIQERYS
jgi:DNA primase